MTAVVGICEKAAAKELVVLRLRCVCIKVDPKPVSREGDAGSTNRSCDPQRWKGEPKGHLKPSAD